MASAARVGVACSAVGVGVTARSGDGAAGSHGRVKSAVSIDAHFSRRRGGIVGVVGKARYAQSVTRAAGRGFGNNTQETRGDDVTSPKANNDPDAIVNATSSKQARQAARDALDELLPDGQSINARDKRSGETALIVSAEQGKVREVTTLLAAGADPGMASYSGWTAAHGAAEFGCVRCVQALLDAGASLSPVHASGKTPLDIAARYHGMDGLVTVYLLDSGAEWGLGPTFGEVGDVVDEDGDGDVDKSSSIAESDFEDFEVADDEWERTTIETETSERGSHEEMTSLGSLELLLKRHVPDPSQNFTGATPTVRDIQDVYDFELDGFQKQATKHLLDGDSVVVSAPTGSGKTLVGETAIIAALSRGQKAIYTTPLKALSNQKLREFQEKFGIRRVGLKTGDVDINSTDADIVIMTTEILRNMLYPSSAVAGRGSDTAAGSSQSRTSDTPAMETDDYRLDDVGVVILDEVHYLSDPYRGTVWEETIIYCPSRIQLLCLSATVGNPDDLAGWIEQVHCDANAGVNKRCHVVVSDFRPVPLRWHFSMRPGRMWPGLGPLMDRRGDRIHDDLCPFTKQGAREWEHRNGGDRYDRYDSLAGDGDGSDEYREYRGGGNNGRERERGGEGGRDGSDRYREREGGGGQQYRGGGRGYSGGDGYGPPPSPANDRNARRRLVPHVETTVGQLVAADLLPAVWFIFSRKGCDQAAQYLFECGASLVTGNERSQIEQTLAKFEKENPDAVRRDAIPPLLLGIASHHAGLLPGWKGLVENLFQRNLLKVVFATETLAAGVNMPARSSVLSTLSKRGDSGPRALTSNEFMQMAGRAGRRGFDTVGHVVCMQSNFEGPEEAFTLVTKPPENLKSTFSVSYGMVLNLVKSGQSLGTIRATIERSFGNYLGGQAKGDQTRELRRLLEQKNALTEQLRNGAAEVEPEEWARFVKLDGRLKEERRLLKTVARQTLEQKSDAVRTAIAEWVLLGEDVVFVEILMDSGEKFVLDELSSVAKEQPTRSIGLAPDGSWIDPFSDDSTSSTPINERMGDLFPDEHGDDTEDGESPDFDEPLVRDANTREKRETVTVAVVETFAPVLDTGGNKYPFGEFLAVDKQGTWFRFTADKVVAVRHLELSGLQAADQRADSAGGKSDFMDAAPSMVGSAKNVNQTSARWRRTGDGAWQANGAEVSGADDMDAFLTTQRLLVEKTRAEIAEMKQFSDLRRAVKMNRRREEKLQKLEERIAKAEIRVQEYTAAGWSEFTRVVDILVEQGALDDLIDHEASAFCYGEALSDATRKAEEVAKRRGTRNYGKKVSNSSDPAAWDDDLFGNDDGDESLSAFLEWEPDDVGGETFGSAKSRFTSPGDVDASDAPETGSTETVSIDEAFVAADARRRRTQLRWHDAETNRSGTVLALTDLGNTCSKLRGENELWLGVALRSERVASLTATQIAGLAGALCCDSNRPTSCVYGPSAGLDQTLEEIMPLGSEIASLQFENGMDAAVNLSRPVAALVEAWASGSSWDQVRRDTNLDEGDIARVFRRTAELLNQVPKTRELPMAVRRAARAAGELVLRPPITDLS